MRSFHFISYFSSFLSLLNIWHHSIDPFQKWINLITKKRTKKWIKRNQGIDKQTRGMFLYVFSFVKVFILCDVCPAQQHTITAENNNNWMLYTLASMWFCCVSPSLPFCDVQERHHQNWRNKKLATKLKLNFGKFSFFQNFVYLFVLFSCPFYLI